LPTSGGLAHSDDNDQHRNAIRPVMICNTEVKEGYSRWLPSPTQMLLFMRLQIFSDAHIDYPGARGLPPLVPGARAVIVAGDTCEGLVGAVNALRRKYPPSSEIVVVAGSLSRRLRLGRVFSFLPIVSTCGRKERI
jgi:hypothetical protein